MNIFIRLLQPDLFVAQDFADENPPLVPVDVSAVVHSPRLK